MNQAEELRSGGLTRRSMLRRTAAVGAVAWTAPMVFSTKVHAAGTAVAACPDGSSKVSYLKYAYRPGMWTWDVCDEGAQQQKMSNGLSGGNPGFVGTVTVSVESDKHQTGTILSGVSLTNNGDVLEINIPGGSPPTTNLEIHVDGVDVNGNAISTTIEVHVSCSQAICFQDIHGFFQVLDASTF